MVTSARGDGVGAAARASGVHVETIRYYERIGLVPPPPRTPTGRRRYGAAEVRRLAFVRRARDMGFGLEAIRSLLALAESKARPCAEVQPLAEAHLRDVRTKLANLQHLEAVLSATVARCRGDAAPVCPLLEQLGGPVDREP